jgi:hypothetical protein
LFDATGATPLTPKDDLKSGKFPKFPSVAARDQAVFSAE